MTFTAESKYWRFRHEKFIRGKPELMVQMRRDFSKTQTGHVENSRDVEILKDKVTGLQKKLASMTDDLSELTEKVYEMVVTQKVKEVKCNKTGIDPCPGMKRKVEESAEDLAEQACIDPGVSSSKNGICHEMDVELFETSSATDLEFQGLELFHATHEADCHHTLGVMPNLAEDDVNKSSGVDPDVIKKFHDCLAMLPLEVQSMFVDNLVSSVTS
eukprot:CAMPEP_0116032384 /NCGR_PEP_ID=MMETSP0321-20121206/18133_1 /TAXON_ID=163516 /ORGANISM="Leptocylindrus danicus var. danicus, Strain B650" /LENGTH=214 /DNA_ID=CAMNT_0003507801 /DNA_START=399 /DNA_END=1043 /DNA_ORIENTATION=+